MSQENPIRVLVNGAGGKMGQEVIRAVLGASDMELVGAVDTYPPKADDAGVLVGRGPCGVPITVNLTETIIRTQPHCMVDFTNPQGVLNNIKTALDHKVYPVVGTTGINEGELDAVRGWCEETAMGALIAPNFAIGALLMMRFAQEAAKFLPHVEIIEYHHDQKLDAPSGTALKTAEMIAKVREPMSQGHEQEEEKLPGARGGDFQGMRVHGVRLPGFVAHQEVIFGGVGQVLTIRHDSINRESFMPGVLMGLRKIRGVQGVVYGLDNLIF